MANSISYLIYLAVVLTSVSLGTSLKCYECKSTFNGNCDDVRGKSITEEVCDHSKLVKAFPQTGTKYVCVVHRMAQRDETDLSVVRGCAPDHYCASFEGSKQCVTCDTDLCNTSSTILPSIVLSIISFLCAKYC